MEVKYYEQLEKMYAVRELVKSDLAYYSGIYDTTKSYKDSDDAAKKLGYANIGHLKKLVLIKTDLYITIQSDITMLEQSLTNVKHDNTNPFQNDHLANEIREDKTI